MLHRFGLVRVELLDAARLQRVLQAIVESGRKRRVLGRNSRELSYGRDMPVRVVGPIGQAARNQPVERRIQRPVTTGLPHARVSRRQLVHYARIPWTSQAQGENSSKS